jgi:hypothetical protein
MQGRAASSLGLFIWRSARNRKRKRKRKSASHLGGNRNFQSKVKDSILTVKEKGKDEAFEHHQQQGADHSAS